MLRSLEGCRPRHSHCPRSQGRVREARAACPCAQLLYLLCSLAILSGADTLYYHERQAQLPAMGRQARSELELHRAALRALRGSYLTPQVISCLSVPVSGLPPATVHPFAYAPTGYKDSSFRILVSLQFPYPPKSCRKHLTKPLFIKDSTTKRVLTAGTHISASPEQARFVLTAFS